MDGSEIHFKDEEFALERARATNYKSKVGGKYLKCEQIWYFIKHCTENPDVPHTGYMKAAIAAGVATVSLLDRADLIAYLTGAIATSDRIDIMAPMDVGAGETVGKRSREAEEEDAGVLKERVLRDRNSVLKSAKDFESVLDFFAGPKDNRQKQEEQQQQAAELAAGIKNPRFRDVKEQVFWREHVGSDFDAMNLDTNASFLTASKPVDDTPLPMVASAARSAKPLTAPSTAPSSRGHGSTASASKPKKTGKPGGMPIILVPAGFNSKVVLNMFNAKEFLQDGKLVAWDAVQKSGAKKSSSIIITRTYGRDPSQKVRYEVTEKCPHKRSEDWQRVAAVFVLGAKWQFKDWPFRGVEDGDLVDTFTKIRGFYARFDSDPEVDIMKTWNIRTLNMSKTNRHGDRAAFEAFWDELDKHLALKSSALHY